MTIYFLHTAQTHINTFQPIFEQMNNELSGEHIVVESLLEQAQKKENIDAVQKEIAALIAQKMTKDEDVLLCTCSTIGPLAEQVDRQRVLRVDRPMMEEAIRIGGRIRILATLESTIAPTMALFHDVAGEKPVDVDIHVITEAWPYFEAGDLARYHEAIAKVIEAVAENADVIILAQASMMGALALVKVSCPVLSSPELGVQAIVDRADRLLSQ